MNLTESIMVVQNEKKELLLRYVMSKLDMRRVEELIDETPLISDIQKRFYKHMINARYNKILLNLFEKLELRG